MKAYFKPLRRKIGTMTLLLACLLTIGWLRSESRIDLFYAYGPGSTHGIGSFSGLLEYFQFNRNSWRELGFWRTNELSRYHGLRPDENGKQQPYDPFRDYETVWRRDWFQFHIGVAKFNDGSIYDGLLCIVCTVPYWSIVTPLTLLSAWLLLSKARIKPVAP